MNPPLNDDQQAATALLATVRHMMTAAEIDMCEDMIDDYKLLVDRPMFSLLKTQFSKQIGDYIDKKQWGAES